MDDMLVSSFLADGDDEPDLNELPHSDSVSTVAIPSPSLSMLSDMDVDEPFYVQAFCTFNGMAVVIEYPREHNGWVYRPEYGGHSQHRWDMRNAVSVVARHSTCKKAIVPRETCRNCIMKKIWRRECIDPCNFFFIKAIGDVEDCTAVLATLVVDSSGLEKSDVARLVMHVPKPPTSRRRNDDTYRVLRMRKLEMNLRVSLLNGGGAIRLKYNDGPSMLDIINSYLTISQAGTTFGTRLEPPEPPVVSVDATEDAVIVSPLLVPQNAVVVTNGALSPDTVRARTVCRPATQLDMYNTYCALLPLLDQPTSHTLKSFRNCFRCDPPFHMMGELAALTHLSRRLGGDDATLIIPTRLSLWLDRLAATVTNDMQDKSLHVNFGVVTPKNRLIENDVLMGTSDSGVSSVVVNPAYLRIHSQFSSIIVAYCACTSVFAVPVSDILPLGIFV